MPEAKIRLSVDGASMVASEFDRVNASMSGMSLSARAAASSMVPVEMSAKQMAFALRGLPAQFTDIAVSLQGGQKPLTVFLQQGGQLKDMFGGAGNAAKAMSGYVLGMISPLTVGAAAIGAIGLAAYQGSKEQRELANSLVLTGGFAGKTAEQLTDIAAGMAKVSGTQSASVEALSAMISTGKIAGDSLQKFSQVATQAQELLGQSVADTAKQFVALGNEPVAESMRLNQSMNYLTASTFEQIKAASDLGDKEAAAAIAQNAYADAVSSRAVQIKQNLGLLESAWGSLGKAAKWSWDQMMNVGREQTFNEKLSEQRKVVQNLAALVEGGSGDVSRRAKLLSVERERLGIMESDERMTRKAAEAQNAKAALDKAGIEGISAVTKANASALTKQEQMNKALGDYKKSISDIKAANPSSTLLDAKQITKTEAAIKAQYADKSKKGGGSAALNDDANAKIEALKRAQGLQEILVRESVDRIGSEHKRGMVNDIDFINQVAAAEMQAINGSITAFEAEKVIAASKKNSKKEVAALDGSIAAAKEKLHARELAQGYAILELDNKLALENAKNNADLIDGLDKAKLAIDDQTKKEIEAIEVIGLDAKAIANLEIARINDTAASKDRMAALMAEIDPAIAQGYRDQAAALRGLAVAKGEKQAKTELNTASEKAKQEQVDLWKQIDSTAESVFMDIAKNGTSAFKHLEDELKNGLLKLLYEMTVKKWIISIGSDLTGLDLGSMLGGGSGGGGLFGKGLDLFGGLFGGGGGTAAVSAGAVSGVSTTSLAGIEAASAGLSTLSTAATGAGAAATAGAAGVSGMGSAIMGAIPGIGWLAAGAVALFSIFGFGKDKIPTVLNDLSLFNNSLIGLPFLELAIGSDEAAQGLRDVLYGLDNATPTMRKLAGETISLSVELLRASGDIAGAANLARNLGTRGMSEAEIAVYDYNESLRAQIEAQRAGAAAAQSAAAAYRQIEQQRYDASYRLNVLLGRLTQTEADRAKELASTTDEETLKMLRLIHQLQDYNTALDKSYATLEKAVDIEKKFAQDRLNAATTLQNAIRGTQQSLAPLMSRAYAQSQLGMYLALAKAGGVLPTAEALQPLLSVLKDTDKGQYANAVDAARDAAITANKLGQLADYAGDSVSDAQQQIAALDNQLNIAKAQLDELRGIKTTTMSTTDAINTFAKALTELTAAQAGAGTYVYTAPTVAGGGGGVSTGGGGILFENIAGQDNADIVAAYRTYYNRNPDAGGYENYLKSGLTGDALMQAILGGAAGDVNGTDFLTAKSKGYDPLEPLRKYLKSKNKSSGTAGGGGGGNVGIDSLSAGTYGLDLSQPSFQNNFVSQNADNDRAARQETNRLIQQLVDSNSDMKKRLEAIELNTANTSVSTEGTRAKLTRLAGEKDQLTVKVAS